MNKKRHRREKKGRRARPEGGQDATESPPRQERKDRVLQARVSQTLHKELVIQARRLRIPVSNLVRNILEDSTRMVENIVDSSLDIAEALSGGVDDTDLSSVLGWQPMTTNRQVGCAQCAEAIPKGSQAFVSVGAPGGRTYVICEGCKSER